MTLSSTTTKVQYAGDGSTTAFNTTFSFWDSSDIRVVLTVDSTGVETVWSEGTEYTVTGGSGATGTVTAGGAYIPASGETLTIKSALPETQLTDLVLGGEFPSTDVEEQLDKTVRLIQQHSEEIARALLIAETSAETGLLFPSPSAGKVMRWNTGETALENVDLVSGAVITTPVSILQGGTGSATAAAARTALNADPDDLSQDDDMVIAQQVFGA